MIRLPSQSGLNPNLSPVLGVPLRLIGSDHSPDAIAVLCDGIQQGFREAAETAPEGSIVGTDDLIHAADWLAAVARTLRAVRQ